MLLKHKTSIITGCNRGIGLRILETFVQNGANVDDMFDNSLGGSLQTYADCSRRR